MKGVDIFQSIIETARGLIDSGVFRLAYHIGNAFTRKRELSFENLLYYLVNASKKSMSANIADFREDFSVLEFPDLSKQAVSKARKGIHYQAFAELHRISVSKYYELRSDLKSWYGFPVYAVDGTSLQLPQTNRNRMEFGSAGNQNDSPCAMASASILYDLLNDIVVDARICRYNYGERRLALQHIEQLECIGFRPDTVLIFDRGYPSYGLFRELNRKGLLFAMRLNRRFNIATESTAPDTSIDYRPREYKTEGGVKLRVIRLTLDDGTAETLVTNLFDPEITLEMFRELYFLRWGIECKYKEFKEQLELEEFTGSRPSSILQDFYISMFLTNLVSMLKADVDATIKEQQQEEGRKKYSYQANRSFLISRVQKHLLKLLCGMERIADTLLSIVTSAQKVVSQIQPGRKFERKRKQSRRKHYNNRKPCR